MKLKAFTFFLFTALLFNSCSSDDKSNNCEEDDFGYLKLNIPSSTNRTSVLYTSAGNPQDADEQVIAANKTSATLEIPYGTYNISVSQINSDDQAVTEPVLFTNVNIEQCETTTRSVVFAN